MRNRRVDVFPALSLLTQRCADFPAQMQRMLTEYFDSQDLTYVLNNFSATGGSDYWPFIHNGESADGMGILGLRSHVVCLSLIG